MERDFASSQHCRLPNKFTSNHRNKSTNTLFPSLSTGKKADFVQRLQDSDAGSAGAQPAVTGEDEIDWDDEPALEAATKATTEPAADALAAGGIGEIPNPQNVPNQIPAIDPAATDELSVDPPVVVSELPEL